MYLDGNPINRIDLTGLGSLILVFLFSGKLFVVDIKCSLILVGDEVLILFQLTSRTLDVQYF
jgi:hypothetical protein